MTKVDNNKTILNHTHKGKITLVQKAYNLLKEQIVAMKIPPGTKIEELDLVDKLGIGRTPIREALRILISEGLVISYGSNATYIKDLSLKSAKDLLSLIHHMGSLVFELINPEDDFSTIIFELELLHGQMHESILKEQMYLFANLNAEFHKTMARAANNQYLDTILERIYSEEVRLGYMLSMVKREKNMKSQYYELLQDQHYKMIFLLNERKLEKLKDVYREHLSTGMQRLLFYFSEY